MRFTLQAASAVAVFVSLVDGKACRPDVCSLVVQGQRSDSPQQIADHLQDCSSFLSTTIIPETSTVYKVVSSTVATSSDTVSVLSSTETDTVTVSSTLTSVSIDLAATTVESTETSTTTTTSTTTSTAVVVSSSTWTSLTTITTFITGISSATNVLTSVASVTVSSTMTETTTKTSTSTSIAYSQQAPAKRIVVISVDQPTTIIPSNVPQYATQACSASSLYSSACAAWGVLAKTTTAPTPTTVITNTVSVTDIIDVDGHTVVTVNVSVTSTITDISVDVSSTTLTHTDSATETDTLTSSATVTSTSIVPVEVVSTKVLTSYTAITLTTTTTTTLTGTATDIETASRTISTTVAWCTNEAVIRGGGCSRTEWTLYCNQAISPFGINRVVFNAPQKSLEQCINICDSNGFCTSGQFNGETGQCLLYLYASSGESLYPTTGAVTAFVFIYNTEEGRGCPSYECPSSSAAECCGGTGCANLQPPY